MPNILQLLKQIFLWLVILVILSLLSLTFFNLAFDVDLLTQADFLFSAFTLLFFNLFLGISLWFLAYPYIYSLKQKTYKSKDLEFQPINSFKLIISIILHITALIQLIIIGTPIKREFTSIIDIFIFFELTILVILVFSVIYTIKQILTLVRHKLRKGDLYKDFENLEDADKKKILNHIVNAKSNLFYGLLGILLAISFSVTIIIIFSILNMKGLTNEYNSLFVKLPMGKELMMYFDLKSHINNS